ncbi:hypothetical protein MMC25_001741 [Agyrium rufum]|nr:hypothetical protein [Agyrium rufum]
MSSKRTRAAFEADLQAQQSPYVLYGTPLPALDPEIRDDGSYVPIWKQEVTDERGRKRLHGAFTGGFSAGYFNTVGSKEGWAPSTFVSSRKNRTEDAPTTTKNQQKPEDFMDEEDLAELEESRKLQTSDSYAALGSTGEEVARRDAFMDLFASSGETMGVKLLRRMGWRDGQGVGPRVRRKARHGEGDENGRAEDQEKHLFAPENSPMISFVRKNDRKGLGFEGESHLGTGGNRTARKAIEAPEEEEEIDPMVKKPIKKSATKRSGFGVGILNDNGSDDDDDPYSMGPQISYGRTIGGDKKVKKKPLLLGESKGNKASGMPSANPLLRSKPVFVSKKPSSTVGFRKCHDGRLPLNGFILSTKSTSTSNHASTAPRYPPPKVPTDWNPSRLSQSTQDAPTSSSLSDPKPPNGKPIPSLNPTSRAALLSEPQLPSKSVFAYLSPAARSRLATATGKTNLPAAESESAGPTHASLLSIPQPSLADLIPALDPNIAKAALGRGVGGWMPYAEDEEKRGRYRAFLEYRAGLRDVLAPVTTSTTNPGGGGGGKLNSAKVREKWINELFEFANAATIFKPMTGLMANRFTSATQGSGDQGQKKKNNNNASETGDAGSSSSSSSGPKSSTAPPPGTATAAAATGNKKPKDPAEEAAGLSMFGPLTRSSRRFYPSRLLCKRFNVKVPDHVVGDGETVDKPTNHSTSSSAGTATATITPNKSGNGAAVMDFVSSRFQSAGFQNAESESPNALTKHDSVSVAQTAMGGEGQRQGHNEKEKESSERTGRKTVELLGKMDMDALRKEGGYEIPDNLQTGAADGKHGGAGVDAERNEALEAERPGEAIFKAIFGDDDDDSDED